MPSFSLEEHYSTLSHIKRHISTNKYFKNISSNVVGIDEVGRGSLAGPVVAAAVQLKDTIPDKYLLQINDSKKVSQKKREELTAVIKEHSIWSIEEVSERIVDEKNILQASLLCMRLALEEISKYIEVDVCLVDGRYIFTDKSRAKLYPVTAGDARSYSIAAASIIAKNYRDQVMKELSLMYPQYGWETNKGYPTKKHMDALRLLGPCPHHRLTFLKNIKLIEN